MSSPDATSPARQRGSSKTAERRTGDFSGSRHDRTSPAQGLAVLTSGSEAEKQAIEYAERYGWHILPANFKRPIGRLVPNGLNNATSDVATIREWWRQEPDANIAISCRKSGVFVIDRDDRHNGDDEIYDLELRHGRLPDTVHAITPNGAHFYFKSPGGKTIWKICDGVDLRDRAYVIAPRSLHKTGRHYEWGIHPEELSPAPFPDNWLPLITRKPSSGTYRQNGPIPKGRRNATLTQIAGAFRRIGSSPEAIEAALMVTNTERCWAPLPASEVRKIARSIGKRSRAPKWTFDAPGYVADLAETGIPLNATQRLVLMSLCHRAKHNGHVIGGDWLEKETNLTRKTVRVAIQALEAQGLAEVRRQHRRTNQIWLQLPDLSHSHHTQVVVGG